MTNKTDEEILIDDMYAIVKKGADLRDTGQVNPYRAGTIEYFLSVQGWITRDLQIALCRADPKYRASQVNSVPDVLLAN